MKVFQVFSKRMRVAVIGISLLVAAIFGVDTGMTQSDDAARGLGGRRVTIVSTSANVGTQVTVSVELDAQGNEVATSFTLNFNPNVLSNPVVVLGSGVPANTSVGTNSAEVAAGRLGVLVDSSNTFDPSPPDRQVVRVTFSVLAGAPAGPSPITFSATPTAQIVSNSLGTFLPTTFENGTVTVTQPSSLVTIGGRVTTPSGQNLRNAPVSLIDANGVRRVATTSSFGLYSFSDVATGQTYTLTVASKRYRFSPRVETITAAVSNLDFVGLE